MIYISGPITGTDDYMERFEAAEKELKEAGYAVINPARTSATLPAATDYKGYMEVALTLLSLCDGIYMLDGWENSRGARLEHAYAETMGIGIRYQSLEHKKYLWKLNGHFDSDVYLNYVTESNTVTLETAIETEICRTHMTEKEYRFLAEKFCFPKGMFAKEEIE